MGTLTTLSVLFICVPYVSCEYLTVNEFSTTLDALVKRECSHNSISEGYQNLISRGKITIAKLEPLKNVKEYASKLYKLFLKKAEALEKVVQDVEEEATKYPWNPLLKNISFVSLTDKGENLTRHHYFNIPVNTSQSGVYVPSEVYINDSVIAHQVDWTSNLDHIFQQQNDTLNFIYFASEYGFLRTYPRYQWPLDDKLRALDARRQSWYTQYTGVPKDVLFLMDTSGSMHGQALHLANTSLRLLIENLNKNDFFAVAKFPTNRTHLTPSLIYGCFINGSCYDSLVQATSLNKQHVIQNVFRLTAHDAADYDEAIAFGMKLMSIFSAGRPASAHCNKILVLISDSDIYYNDTTVQILERYQDYVHLFTYSLSTITASGPLNDVAKRINGAFAQIPVIGALSNILRHFTDYATHFGSSKKLHPQKLDLVVHHAADIFPFKIAEEIGPMASLTMAVYNRSTGLSLLGIMGTDVSAREMVDLLQTYLNSPTDYAFMVDNNGFVLFHPLLRSYRKLSAQTIDIDIMDIEASNVTEMLTIRKHLIDNQEGVTILDDFAVFMDEVHAHRTLRTYAYTPIPETDYSICVVTATDRDIDVQYLSQKEHLDTTEGTVLIDGRDISSLLLPVNVVLSPILANCRKPSFSRILAPPTTLTTTTTTSTTTTTTPEPTTTQSSTLDQANTTLVLPLEGLFANGGPDGFPELFTTMGENATELMTNESLSRKRRDWLTDFFADDPNGVEQIKKVLRFVGEYDFGNTYYEGHFLSDLLVGLDVLQAWGSSPMSKDVISRSVFFTSGLGFIYPSHTKQEFEPLMTADFANSSIWQRVLDSHGLLFWIQPKLTEPLVPDLEWHSYFTFPPTTEPSSFTTVESEASPHPAETTTVSDKVHSLPDLPPIPEIPTTSTHRLPDLPPIPEIPTTSGVSSTDELDVTTLSDVPLNGALQDPVNLAFHNRNHPCCISLT
uniref:VGCC_alpha2 domain-containing protein n=1 Tax=Mesocestoides corti TaxID=53468 RepID=A0A5K3EG66_MESCO